MIFKQKKTPSHLWASYMYSSWLAAGVSIGPGEGHQSVDIGHELCPWQSSDRKQLILLPWGAVVNTIKGNNR